MRLHALVRPFVFLALVGALGAAAYLTRGTWWSYVFPTQSAPKNPDEPDHEPAEEDEPPKVKLSVQAQQNIGLEAAELTPREYWRTMVIPGIVVDRPGESDRRLSSKVAGVVTDIKVRLGDSVRPGDALFTIQLVSEVLQTAQGELARAATDLKFAVVERDRVAGLVKLGTTPASEVTKLQNQMDRFTNQMKAVRRQLQALGLTAEQIEKAESGDTVAEVTVVAPGIARPVSFFSGTLDSQFEVRLLSVALGDYVQAGQVLCQLADHRRLLVEGSAFKSEAKAIAATSAGRVPVCVEIADENAGDWPTPDKLFIRHISEHVDPATRTFAFFLPLENQQDSGVWRYSPGQRVRLRVPLEKMTTRRPDGTEVNPFVLPVGAVVREGPDTFVFVQVGNVFIRRTVRVLHEDRSEIAVAQDGSITRADTVVRSNAAALNRAVKAAAGGDGHAGHTHEH